MTGSSFPQELAAYNIVHPRAGIGMREVPGPTPGVRRPFRRAHDPINHLRNGREHTVPEYVQLADVIERNFEELGI